MKKTLKGYVLGFLSASLLLMGIGYAANTTTLYNVLTQGIKIVVDGQKINPTDVNGNTVEPIIYNGTTYLPVRAVANALGKAVYWDGPNYTVYLGSMDGDLEYPTLRLDEATNIGDEIFKTENKGLYDNYGNIYEYAFNNFKTIWGGGENKTSEYILNMKYSRVKGTIYIAKGDTNNSSGYITITTDGKTIYTSPVMTKSSAPIDFDVSIKGCIDLKINWVTEGLLMHIGDTGFYQ